MAQQALIVSDDDIQAEPKTTTPAKTDKLKPLIVSESDLEPAKPTDPKKDTPAKPGVLGDATKKASLKPPETWGAYGKRQVKAVGKTLYESIPLVTGATGAMVAGAAATPSVVGTGPVGPAMAAVVGAGAGGLVGRRIQQYIDSWTGKAPLPPAAKAVGEMGREATKQMEFEAGGRIVAAPLGWIRRGGFLKNTPAVKTLAEDRALGTRLSGPEIATGTDVGEIAKTVQAYSAGAFKGGRIQAAARRQGSAAALKVVDDSLALLGHPGMGGGPTATSRGSAAAAKTFVGEMIDKAADSAPPIDVRSVKETAAKELERTIVQHLSAVPDVANPGLAKVIRQIRADPSLIQRLPRPTMTRLADTLMERYKSPTMALLRRIAGMEDDSAARGVWEESKSLRRISTPEDQLYAKSDQQRIATMLNGQLREKLTQAAPELSQALGQYRDLVRGDYLRENIVLGGKPVPTSEKAVDDVLTGMAERLRAAKESGRLARQFNDETGQQVVRNLTQVANLMEKRTAPMAGNLRKIFELGRIMNIPLGMVTGHLNAGMTSQTLLWEGFPDFFTWVIHDPKATQWFIEGVKAPNPETSSAAVIRLMELYRRTHGEQGKKAEGKP